ncbi:hypothetical protein ZIOFF_056398 [Zingiber officinale]|uniref:Uncharacterized protein n=1 Tax=Zingiber officinale TaxID=94328 RepID=A0A8J5KPD9_ZINOF|nr:hypothetical protein ZIOFF_056398 [Zingiber officinale]
MANIRMRKLIQNSQRRFRREESSNRRVDDENESQYTTSHSPLEIQNEEVNEQVENEVMPSSQSQQRKRGKTIMRDIHALHPDHVLVVEFNERGQPYGDLQPTLANFIGTIARNGLVLPLHFLDWRKMPTNRLNDAWKLVTSRFYIPNHHRRVIMQMMGAAWRRWRTEVKATSYDSNIPLEELVAIQPIPHGLTPQTWEVLCNYWKSTESQENGRKPSRIEIQQLSRRSRKKGGAAIDDEAIRTENLLKEAVDRLLKDKPEGTQPLEVHEEAFRFMDLSILVGYDVYELVRCLAKCSQSNVSAAKSRHTTTSDGEARGLSSLPSGWSFGISRKCQHLLDKDQVVAVMDPASSGGGKRRKRGSR